MKNYGLTINGCDDSTGIEIELTDDQASFVKTLCELFTSASGYQCQPTMSMRENTVDKNKEL